jgi:hypothetical protein
VDEVSEQRDAVGSEEDRDLERGGEPEDGE